MAGLRQAQTRVNRGRTSQTRSIPAPVGGWNVRDSIADMDDKDAVILNNMFCLPDTVINRKGSLQWVTGITGTVETIASYQKQDGTSKLFASSGTSPNVAIYDVTSSGAVGAAVVSGKSSDKWQYLNFSTPGGQYLYMVNGVDSPMLYDGAAWTAITGVSVPAITGVTTSTFIHINTFKQRLFFIEANSMSAWYLPVQSIGGAASELDFSSFCKRGGYLMAMFTWTFDAGYGMDDHAVFVTSEGEVLVYRGTDPASVATWGLVGIYTIGRPIGRRCGKTMGKDILIICQDGVFPLSQAIVTSLVTNKAAITDKIQAAASEAVTNYGSNFGWEILIFPLEDMVILNIPIGTNLSSQYVMNAITGAWSSWTNLNASCWVEQNGAIYFGGLGTVWKAWIGTSDAINTSAAPGTYATSNIEFEALQAFSYLGIHSLKAMKLCRPVVAVDSPSIGLLAGVNVDYDTSAPTGVFSVSSVSAGVYDTSLYDQAVYGGSFTINKDWLNASGLGYAIAMHIVGSSQTGSFRWASTDYIFQTASGI